MIFQGCLTCNEILHDWGKTSSGVYTLYLYDPSSTAADKHVTVQAYCEMKGSKAYTWIQRFSRCHLWTQLTIPSLILQSVVGLSELR